MAVCGSYFITTYIQTKRKRKNEKEKERQCYDQYLMFAMWLHHGLHVLGLFLYDAMIGYTIAISVSYFPLLLKSLPKLQPEPSLRS